jgi:hypothetical protein
MNVITTELKPQRALRVLQQLAAKSSLSSFFTCALLGLLCLGLWQPVVVGAPISYGSHVGTTVNYINVAEDTTTSDPVPLFGAPIFSADSIDFNPVGFDAHAMGAGGSDVTGARLTFDVEAQAGKFLRNISFSEAGDTTLAGAGNDSTATAVTATGTITVTHASFAPITPVVQPIALTFTPSGGGYGLGSDGGGGPIFSQQWSGSLLVNINQIVPNATRVSIDLTNTLTASSQAGTMAIINKQDFGGISITVNIPEPGSLVLGVLGAVVWVGLGRVRRGC